MWPNEARIDGHSIHSTQRRRPLSTMQKERAFVDLWGMPFKPFNGGRGVRHLKCRTTGVAVGENSSAMLKILFIYIYLFPHATSSLLNIT